MRETILAIKNERGEWVPTIPEPHDLLFGGYGCNDCEAKFDKKESYALHYRSSHEKLFGIKLH